MGALFSMRKDSLDKEVMMCRRKGISYLGFMKGSRL